MNILDLAMRIQERFFSQIVSSGLFLVAILIVRSLVARRIYALKVESPDMRRRMIVNLRNGVFLGTVIGLVLIWARELQTVAVSVVAIAAAIVLATKELILCLSGSVMRGSARSYDIGDRIEVLGMRGDVIDVSLLTTTLMEIGPGQLTHAHTGRAFVIPNSIFLSNTVVKENFMKNFIVNATVIPMKIDDDWRTSEQLLLEAARQECAPFLEEARANMHELEEKHGLDTPSLDPRVLVQMPEPGRISLVLRYPVPARRRGRQEQAVLRRYLEALAAHKAKVPPSP